MTTDAPTFAQTIDIIRNLHNVRWVSVSGDRSLVEVFARVYYDGSGDMQRCSEVLFDDIVARLKPFRLIPKDCVVIDSDSSDFDAVEVWIFSR